MRDPTRIDRLMIRLWAMWKQYPDLRFGQFLINVFPGLIQDNVTTWNAEIDAWMKALGEEVEEDEFKF